MQRPRVPPEKRPSVISATDSPIGIPFNREVSASISRLEPATRSFGVFRPEILSVSNTHLPYSINDGDLWAGRGRNSMIAAGFFARFGRVQIVVAPQLVGEENRYFQLHIPAIDRPTIPPDSSQWQFEWYAVGPYSVDMPTRFGDRPIKRLTAGQSSILVGIRNVQIGLSNENEWWGPGIGCSGSRVIRTSSSLMMSSTFCTSAVRVCAETANEAP